MDPILSGATPVRLVPALPPDWPMSLAAHADRTLDGEFRPGDTFASVLRRAEVSASLIDRIARSVHDDFDVRRIRAGRPYKIYFGTDDELLLFRYRPDRQTATLVAKGSEGWGSRGAAWPPREAPASSTASSTSSSWGSRAPTTWSPSAAVTPRT